MALIKIITLIMLFCASIFLLYWVFRPGTKEKYKKYSEIPLKKEMKDVSPSAKKDNNRDRKKQKP